ncbi:MAG: hypothetical protein ACKO3K_03640 [Cuspidothrix sp.]
MYISTELEEVMAISDRIVVMYKGEFMDILDAQIKPQLLSRLVC